MRRRKYCVPVLVAGLIGPILACGAAADDEQPKTPQLSIVGVGQDGISLTRSVGEFRHTLTVESNNKNSVGDLTIDIAPFVGPDGAEVDVTATVDGEPLASDTPLTIEGLGDLHITLAATLAVSGDYRMPIVLRYADSRQTTVLSVSRTRVPVEVTLSGSGVTTETLPLATEATASFWINAEADGNGVQLLRPTLKKLARVVGDVNYASDHTAPEFTHGDDSPVVWPAGIAATSSDSFRVSLGGIESPGQYQATLAFSAAERTPKEITVGFEVKRSGWLAVAIIAFGLAVSMGLRSLREDVQPRLQQQVDVLNLLRRLQQSVKSPTPLPPEDEGLKEAIEERLKALYERLRIAADPDADATLDEVAAKLPLVPILINTHAELLRKEASAQATLKPRLMDYYVFVQTETSTATEITAAKAGLLKLRDEVHKAAFPQGVRGSKQDPPMSDIEVLTATTLTKLVRSRRFFDFGVLGVAIVLGLYLLWAPDSTWGDTGDLFVAFLWGLGLHTVSATKPFEGLGGLAGRFGAP